MSTNITNHDDIIDIRDVIERFEELREELTEKHEAGQFASEFDDWIANSRDNSDPVYAVFPGGGHEVQSNIEEFYKLRALLEECKGNGGDEQWEGDWYPVTLIRESHFQDYAQELAEEIGAVNANATWPNNCIDWEQAARELQYDYTGIEFDGVTYYTR